jgi:pyruvate/2-oxoglutarate dehydrogenase complex dihydrolipoamide dehydrogenase (E3) component
MIAPDSSIKARAINFRRITMMSARERAEKQSSVGQRKTAEHDLVILDSGTGTRLAAWTLAAQGQRVAVIERPYISGARPNIARMPSKNVIHSVKIGSPVRHSDEFGIVRETFRIDTAGERERKRGMVSGSIDLHRDEYKKSEAELILGSARFVGPRIVDSQFLDGSTPLLHGRNVMIGTGTRAGLEPISGLVDAQPLTYVGAQEPDQSAQTPDHLGRR